MFVEYPLFSGARALSSSYKKSFGKKSYISYTRHQNFPYLLAVSGEGLGVGFHFQGVGYPYFTCKTVQNSRGFDMIPCKMHKETARFNSVFLLGRLLGTPNEVSLQTFPLAPVGRVPSGRVSPKVRSLCSFCPGLSSFCPLRGALVQMCCHKIIN